MSDTKLTRIGIEISQDLKTDVKMKCAKEGITIRQAVEALLTKWVEK